MDVGPFRALAQPNKTIDPILSRGKSGDKSEDGASNAATSPDEIQKKAEEGDAEAQFDLGVLYDYGEAQNKTASKPPNGIASPPSKGTPRRSSISAFCITTARG